MRLLASSLLLVLMLQGCGLKGPLYIPTAAELQEIADRQKRLEERTAREKLEQQQGVANPEQ